MYPYEFKVNRESKTKRLRALADAVFKVLNLTAADTVEIVPIGETDAMILFRGLIRVDCIYARDGKAPPTWTARDVVIVPETRGYVRTINTKGGPTS